MSKPNQRLVSGFPGVGKSWLSLQSDRFIDFDSTQWSDKSIYAQVASRARDCDVTESCWLISSHEEVRRELQALGVDYLFVAPEEGCKEEYLERYRKRGNTEDFIDFLDSNWSYFVKPLRNEIVCSLSAGEFLGSVFL